MLRADFRIIRGGDISVGDTLTLAERVHPEWPLSRVGRLFYSQATVAPQGGLFEQRGESFCGTDEEFDELLHMDKLAWYEWRQCLAARAADQGEGGQLSSS